MKMHSTNYQNTFIEVADDCPVSVAEVPGLGKGGKTVAQMQYEMVKDNPYQYTSDEVFFTIFAQRNEIPVEEWEEARTVFFSKGQPCFRASPLTKRYGWGVHSDAEGRVAMYARESEAYTRYLNTQHLNKVKAMRSSKK